MDDEKIILVCEDSLEGIFSAIYDGWKWKLRGRQVVISVKEPEYPDFFTTVMKTVSDSEKAGKVLRTVSSKLGHHVYEAVCYAAASCHPDRGTLVFQVLWMALSGKKNDRRVLENMADPAVNTVAKLRIRVWHELHRYYGFVRFREIGGRVLFSEISPENDILEMLGPHFSDRFPNEDWMIYDSSRCKVLLHPRGQNAYIQKDAVMNPNMKNGLEEKEEYEELWKRFCSSVTIQERKNPHLQQQFLPLKFRSKMTEFS